MVEKVYGLNIFNNLIDKNYYGILCEDSSEINISENKIFDNVGIGIIIGKASSDFIIVKNRIYNNRQYGVALWGLIPYTYNKIVRDNKILNNTFTGIVISGCSGVVINNNFISKQSIGIQIFQGGMHNIQYNDISDNIKAFEQYNSMINTFKNNNLCSTLIPEITSTGSISPFFILNYFCRTFISPRHQCSPILAPLIFFPWRLKPVPINQTWPD